MTRTTTDRPDPKLATRYGFFVDDLQLVEASENIADIMKRLGTLRKERKAASQTVKPGEFTDQAIGPINAKIEPLEAELESLRKSTEPRARDAVQRFLSSHAERRRELLEFVNEAVDDLQNAIGTEDAYRAEMRDALAVLPVGVSQYTVPSYNIQTWFNGFEPQTLKNTFGRSLNAELATLKRQAARPSTLEPVTA